MAITSVPMYCYKQGVKTGKQTKNQSKIACLKDLARLRNQVLELSLMHKIQET